jgi:hypothetical protein
MQRDDVMTSASTSARPAAVHVDHDNPVDGLDPSARVSL